MVETETEIYEYSLWAVSEERKTEIEKIVNLCFWVDEEELSIIFMNIEDIVLDIDINSSQLEFRQIMIKKIAQYLAVCFQQHAKEVLKNSFIK
ncbi:hypothetical protein [uncultured archaeal virus]|uniref:Uncharacterized protein n=1 Tax=uncultured archaeal virus TaxID=1960247 RepID=A0A8B0LTR8_9VIRU|nr:hypothetical protein [uncultured archaeal virus]